MLNPWKGGLAFVELIGQEYSLKEVTVEKRTMQWLTVFTLAWIACLRKATGVILLSS